MSRSDRVAAIRVAAIPKRKQPTYPYRRSASWSCSPFFLQEAVLKKLKAKL